MNASVAPGAVKRPKLVHVSTSDMSIGVLLLNQLRAFERAGFDVVAVCSPGNYIERVRDSGITVIPVPMARAITPLQDLVSIRALHAVFREQRPDIVHTHTPKAGLLAQYAALAAGVPLRVHTIHGLYFPGDVSPRLRWFYVQLERLTMRFAHLVFSQNPEDIPVAISERICRPEQIRYLGNGIDMTAFDPSRVDCGRVKSMRQEMGFDEGDVVIGIVGRVNREKGYIDFFDAAPAILAACPRAKFLIVGPVESEKTNSLDPIELARSAGVSNALFYAGLRDDMPELYKVMDVLVLPSYREGFPRAPMEAAAMEIPCIATNIRGCRQVVIDRETGFLIPTGDAPALSGAVLELARSPDLRARMGQAGRRLAIARFDERDVIERTLDGYESILRQSTK